MNKQTYLEHYKSHLKQELIKNNKNVNNLRINLKIFFQFLKQRKIEFDYDFIISKNFPILFNDFIRNNYFLGTLIMTKRSRIPDFIKFFEWCETQDELKDNNLAIRNLDSAIAVLKKQRKYLKAVSELVNINDYCYHF